MTSKYTKDEVAQACNTLRGFYLDTERIEGYGIMRFVCVVTARHIAKIYNELGVAVEDDKNLRKLGGQKIGCCRLPEDLDRLLNHPAWDQLIEGIGGDVSYSADQLAGLESDDEMPKAQALLGLPVVGVPVKGRTLQGRILEHYYRQFGKSPVPSLGRELRLHLSRSFQEIVRDEVVSQFRDKLRLCSKSLKISVTDAYHQKGGHPSWHAPAIFLQTWYSNDAQKRLHSTRGEMWRNVSDAITASMISSTRPFIVPVDDASISDQERRVTGRPLPKGAATPSKVIVDYDSKDFLKYLCRWLPELCETNGLSPKWETGRTPLDVSLTMDRDFRVHRKGLGQTPKPGSHHDGRGHK